MGFNSGFKGLIHTIQGTYVKNNRKMSVGTQWRSMDERRHRSTHS